MKKPVGKIGTVLIIIATVILAGVAVFTAYRLYQLRQQPVAPNVPSSYPKADELTCQPETGDTWCSNSIEANKLTVDHDVADWGECLAWCKENMSSDMPICQFNGDGPRSCWVKYPPAGGINSCIWQAGASYPKGSCYQGANPTTTPTSEPGMLTIDIVPSCNETKSIATITWPATDKADGYQIRAEKTATWDGISKMKWHKLITDSSITSTKIPAHFVKVGEETVTMPDLIPGTEYSVLVHYRTDNIDSEVETFTALDCTGATGVPSSTPTASPQPTGTPSNFCSLSFSITSTETIDPTPTPTATATGTASPTATATSTATATATGTATAKATATTITTSSTTSPTEAALPQSGTNWPTMAGIFIGMLVILGSLLLAF